LRAHARRRARTALLVLTAALAATATPQLASAASPDNGTLSADGTGAGNSLSWTGSVHPGSETGGSDEGTGCFDPTTSKPADPTVTGCDIFTLKVSVPADFYKHFIGGPFVRVGNFGGGGVAPDLDLFIYKFDPSTGAADLSQPAASSAGQTDPEQTTITKGSGSYYVVVVPFATGPTQTYDGLAKFIIKPRPSIADVNARAPEGAVNYRASHDRHISHSEPTIAMDPLDHNHLIAGSKQYDNLGDYLFKIGTYESFDGGRTWRDYDQLPGYCTQPSDCDPTQPTKYRDVSDISMTFDDEGNAYAFVLDSPGGVSGTGWNMNLHIKQPGRPWSGPIVVHNNQGNPVQDALFLDDKNWLAIDNNHLPDGSPNKPRDGKIGPMYTCWGFDQANNPVVAGQPLPIPGFGQSIVFMRSTDGGHTWGGVVPGDNTPIPLSQKGAISGIGCHIIVDPTGAVYVTWYDNQLDAIMQVKSTDFGRTFTPARPIAQIMGQNTAFPGQAFRNLSIPTTGVDSQGNVYVAVMSQNGTGAPVIGSAAEAAQKLLEEGQLDKTALRRLIEESGESLEPEHEQGGGETPECPSQDTTTVPCTDIIMFKSTDGGTTYSSPVRVNQDPKTSAADQFQPWMAITPKGQIDISYFDRRNDPTNFLIDTYLSRSNDGGKTFSDVRVTHSVWDPEINPPTSPSGAFIGDYQGLVADDNVAIPFWNDTQYANLPTSDPNYSPYQEVSAARIENSAPLGGPGARPGEASTACTAGVSGFRSAGAKPRKRGVSISFARFGTSPVSVNVYRQTSGRRILGSQLVASFANRTAGFTWNGKANVHRRHVGDGFYVARLRVPVGHSFDQRQIALIRSHGRFHLRPPYVRQPTCAAVANFGLNKPVFGGSRNRSLRAYVVLHRTVKLSFAFTKGKRTIRVVKAKTRRPGRYKLTFKSKGLRAGDYQVKLTAVDASRHRTRATLTARKL
jgi:hypothetical protein